MAAVTFDDLPDAPAVSFDDLPNAEHGVRFDDLPDAAPAQPVEKILSTGTVVDHTKPIPGKVVNTSPGTFTSTLEYLSPTKFPKGIVTDPVEDAILREREKTMGIAPFSLGPAGVQDALSVSQPGQMRDPLVPLPKPENTGVKSGMARAVIGTAESLITPENLMILATLGRAGPLTRTGAGLYFAKEMTEGGIKDLTEPLPNETEGQRAERYTRGVISLALAAVSAKHGVEGRPLAGERTPLTGAAAIAAGTPEEITPAVLERVVADATQRGDLPSVVSGLENAKAKLQKEAADNPATQAAVAEIDAQLEKINAGAAPGATPTIPEPTPAAEAPAPFDRLTPEQYQAELDRISKLFETPSVVEKGPAGAPQVTTETGARPAEAVDFKAEAERIRAEWMEGRAEPTKPEPVTPEVEQKLREAHAQLVAESPYGFPDVPIADLLERAGFTPDAEGLARGKAAIKQLQTEGKMDLGGGDWSLANDKQRASAVIGKPGDPPAIYGKFREAEAPKAEPWRQQAIPEELRTSSELESALSDATEAPKGGAPFRKLDKSQGGALGGAGGGTPVVTPKGATPKGDTNFIRVEPAIKRVGRGLFTEGAADVMEKSKNKVGQLLAKQMRKHVDVEQELYGKMSSEIDRATKGLSGKQVEAAIAELEPYLAAKENGRPLPAISKNAQSLLTAWENIAEQTGLISEAHKVQVFDPKTGGYRDMRRIGRAYVPRMFRPEVQRVLKDPRSDPQLFNDLSNELAAHRGITPEEAATELRGVAGRFQSSDFMGNLEMARTEQLPETFYDYNLGNLTSRYLPAWSERMAQIISYGQRLGAREAPLRKNLWDVAMKEAEDSYTQHWLRAAEDQSANLRAAAGPAKVAQQGQTLASGLLLSSPLTTVFRNLMSGTLATTELLGTRRALAALFKVSKLDAKEIGVIRDNLADFLHADQLGASRADEVIRGGVNKLLKYSGYEGSEGFVRSHAAATASQFAKDAVVSLNKNPASSMSKEALGLFKRLGVDAEKVVAENGDWKTGAETRKFIRTVIRDTQGGYRFDQVPLWANSTAGRILYQFGRYGVQRARNIWRNGVLPFLGEEVQWHGKTMVRRDIRPLLKMGLNAIVLGEVYALAANGFFGRDRKDASVQEITQALGEDAKEGALLAGERLINDIIMSGSFGIAGQPLDMAKSLKDQSRFKNPAEPPAAASVKAVVTLAQNAIDQEGQITNKDVLNFLGSLAPGVKQTVDAARNVFDEPLYEAENDVRTLRSSAARWAHANKIDVPKHAAGEIRKSANAPTYEPIRDALLVGNADRAKFLAEKFIAGEKDKTKARAAVKNSVKGKQPFRVGPFTNGEFKGDFMKWAASHLPKADYEQAQRVQDRYEKAAAAAGLW